MDPTHPERGTEEAIKTLFFHAVVVHNRAFNEMGTSIVLVLGNGSATCVVNCASRFVADTKLLSTSSASQWISVFNEGGVDRDYSLVDYDFRSAELCGQFAAYLINRLGFQHGCEMSWVICSFYDLDPSVCRRISMISESRPMYLGGNLDWYEGNNSSAGPNKGIPFASDVSLAEENLKEENFTVTDNNKRGWEKELKSIYMIFYGKQVEQNKKKNCGCKMERVKGQKKNKY